MKEIIRSTSHQELAREYATLIEEFAYETQQSAEGPFLLPRINIPAIKPRSSDIDADPYILVNEASNNPFFNVDEGIISGALPLPSSHTPATLHRGRLENAIYQITGKKVQLDYPERMYAQMAGWVWDENGDPVSPVEIAKMPAEQQEKYIHAMSGQLHNMCRSLALATDTDIAQADRRIKVYTVFENTPIEEQKQKMLAPAVQTRRSFHVHAAYYPTGIKDKIELSEVGIDDFLKHLGPMDTLLHRKFNAEVIRALGALVPHTTTTNARISSEKDHAVRTDQKGVANFEGYSIKFDSPIHSDKALEIMFGIINKYEDIHRTCMTAFEDYYKSSGYPERQTQIQQQCLKNLQALGFNLKAGELVSFVFANRPTYGQISTWLEENEKTHTLEEKTATHLKRLKNVYEKTHAILSDGEKRNSIEASVQEKYGLTPNEAKLLMRIIEEPYLPREDYRKVKFNIPAHPSGSFLFSKYSIEHDGLWIKEISFATRQEKGVVEDLAETNLSRDKGTR